MNFNHGSEVVDSRPPVELATPAPCKTTDNFTAMLCILFNVMFYT